MDFNLGQLEVCLGWILFMTCPILLIYLFAKKKLTKSRFLRFFGILLIGSCGAMIPFGPFGVLMGFPSVLISSIFVSLFLDKE